MISPIAQRIGKFIAYQKLSRREFASRLGYTSSEKINRLFRKDGAKPGFDIVADIANKFVELNADWLVTGRGEMLRPQNGSSVGEDSPGYEKMCFVPLHAREGYRERFRKEEYIQALPHFFLPGLGGGKHRMFEVGGRSMYPELQEKDKVVGRWITMEDIYEDQACILLSKARGLIICRLGLREAGALWIKGNPVHALEFPSFHLEVRDILEIWDVVLLITSRLQLRQLP
jgi:hypothetical protein